VYQEKERNSVFKAKEEVAYEQWLEKEANFHKNNALLRSEIRIQQGTEQPIDFLVKILWTYLGKLPYDKQIEKEIKEPYSIFDKLSLKELQELQDNIHERKGLEENHLSKEYWEELELLLKEKMEKEELRQAGNKIKKNDFDEDAEEQIALMFDEKTYAELVELEKQIKTTIDAHDFKIDVEYWENVLKRLQLKKRVSD